MARVAPEFDRDEVNAAGVRVRKFLSGDSDVSDKEWQRAIYIVNNWRSAHAHPLNVIHMTLRNSAKRFDEKPLLAQRIKRLVSIASKLERFDSMRLSQMQDLGGCRAIVRSVGQVVELHNYYKTACRQRHELDSEKNYLDAPKKSGYRGVHLIFRYHSDVKRLSKYNGLKIEMQLRSQYQHAWATAVETVGMFSGQALKSSLGSEDWQRFFSLMGSVIALREKMPLIPGTPTSRAQLAAELNDYVTRLKVRERLQGYRHALQAMQRSTRADSSYFLLELDSAEGKLNVTGYAAKDLAEATARYADVEKLAARRQGADSVLVSVERVNTLSRAYPNYFADTRVFLVLLAQALSGHSRGIDVPDLKIPTAPPVVAPTNSGS